jgi:hypothetical protein
VSDTHPNFCGFIKLIRSDVVMELIARNRNAFILLAVIAYRARRTPGFNRYNLAPGEALIGDYESYDLTEQEYRTAKKILSEGQFATFKTTNRGTIATLMDSRVFDINSESSNGQANSQSTGKQRTANGQATSNKETNKERIKDGKKGEAPQMFPEGAQKAIKELRGKLDEIKSDLQNGRGTPERKAELKALREKIKARIVELEPTAFGIVISSVETKAKPVTVAEKRNAVISGADQAAEDLANLPEDDLPFLDSNTQSDCSQRRAVTPPISGPCNWCGWSNEGRIRPQSGPDAAICDDCFSLHYQPIARP